VEFGTGIHYGDSQGLIVTESVLVWCNFFKIWNKFRNAKKNVNVLHNAHILNMSSPPALHIIFTNIPKLGTKLKPYTVRVPVQTCHFVLDIQFNSCTIHTLKHTHFNIW